MSKLTIRRYKSSDNAAMRKLYEQASIDSEIGYRKGPWESDFDDMENHYFPDGEFLLGFEENTLVAMGGYRKVSENEGQVRRMRVHVDFRRKGYAQQILKGIEETAKQNNITQLKLKTSTQQVMAQHFYEKNGYKKLHMPKKEYYTEGDGNSFEVIWYSKKLV